ncbi:arginyl-tRNA synthetase, class Ic [Artemisia annua]|uniref:arginine--tRNA ligase n=1 Tax=Artemisia annua TaxID=35608 RepID=A0A2U1MB46_ARTAN|nr:arginyl-tRNA synthetase, class Ic [Artemisia annua]
MWHQWGKQEPKLFTTPSALINMSPESRCVFVSVLKARQGARRGLGATKWTKHILKIHISNMKSAGTEKNKQTKGASKKKEDKRWSLEEEVNKLIDEALERSFPGLGEKSETFICKEEYGDYQCESVLSIWPKLIEEGTEPKGPKSVGMTIKMELEKRSDMIEGTPCVRSFGFVTFKLSGKWMAKSLNKMVRYGIETWAPKLGFKRVIVEEITDYESSIVGTIRSSFIRDTFIRMLEYSQVSVNANKDEFLRDALSHVSDDKWSFSIEDIDGDAVTSCIVEGKLESLNFGKREIQDVSDSLKILWYALKVERADWIVCLSHVRHLEYVEMCITMKRLFLFQAAGWIPTTQDHKFSFAGYRTHAEPGKLVYLLENALTRCNSLVKQGKAPEYSAERVLCCALRYEYLKNPRMAECSFTVDEMFNEKGNTFLYLLNTKSQVTSVLANFGKDINLKNISELMLEKVELLEKDKGRALGFHLLMFTQILEESCFSVLPHILCQYLHDLSQKFTNYNSSYSRVSEDGSVAETSRLILCEATAVVMEKCFHLLGITPVSISGESLPEPLEILSELKSSCYDSVIPLARYPPKNSRFEIMTICPQINRDLDFKSGKLFGRILVHDKRGFLSDGWVPTYSPDFGMVSLFSSDWYDSIDIVNLGIVSLGNPMSRHSIPLTTSTLRMRAELVVTNEREDAFYHLQSTTKRLRFLDFRDIKGDGECGKIFLGGEDMSVVMYSITLKDAVDTDVEVKFRDIHAHHKVKGYIYAYYGSKFPYLNDFDMGFYTATLLEPSTITAGPVRLSRSKIAVPKKGSLVIYAKFFDVISRKVVLAGRHEFHSKIKGESRHTIRGRIRGCSLHLKVDWKYQV